MPEELDNGVLRYRVKELADAVTELREWRSKQAEPALNDVRYIARDVERLAKTVEGVRRTMIALLVTIAASAVTFALAVLAATGRL